VLFSKGFAKICFLFFPATPTVKKMKEKKNTEMGDRKRYQGCKVTGFQGEKVAGHGA